MVGQLIAVSRIPHLSQLISRTVRLWVCKGQTSPAPSITCPDVEYCKDYLAGYQKHTRDVTAKMLQERADVNPQPECTHFEEHRPLSDGTMVKTTGRILAL